MTIAYGRRLQEPVEGMYAGIGHDEAQRCVDEIAGIAAKTGQTDLAFRHCYMIADALIGRLTVEPEPPVRSVASETTDEGGVIRLEYWPGDGYVLWYHGRTVWKSFGSKSA